MYNVKLNSKNKKRNATSILWNEVSGELAVLARDSSTKAIKKKLKLCIKFADRGGTCTRLYLNLTWKIAINLNPPGLLVTQFITQNLNCRSNNERRVNTDTEDTLVDVNCASNEF